MPNESDADTGEFLAIASVEEGIKIRNRHLMAAVNEMRETIEKMARFTHNRFHKNMGTNWRSCTMISCRLARQQLARRGVTT